MYVLVLLMIFMLLILLLLLKRPMQVLVLGPLLMVLLVV